MSLDTLPFSTAEQDELHAELEEASRSRKALLVAGGVAAALVLGAGAYLFLGGAGDDTADSGFVPVKRAPRAVAAAPKSATTATKKLPTAYREQIGRDPFRALYIAPAQAAPESAAAPAAPVAPAPAPPAEAAAPAPGAAVTPAEPVAARYPLKLVSISQTNDEARFTTWSVDGQKTTVLPAQRFGKHGELVVLAFSKNAKGVVDKAILQVGDDSPMEVAVGQTNSVL